MCPYLLVNTWSHEEEPHARCREGKVVRLAASSCVIRSCNYARLPGSSRVSAVPGTSHIHTCEMGEL
jgi:hypothetical protein